MDNPAVHIGCILLDDEPNNIDYLSALLYDHFPQVQVLAKVDNPIAGMLLIDELQPQLLFLDIEMPGMNGFEVLKELELANFEVIFVTAHNGYALHAFKVHAAGYLTKPINTKDFMAVVQKAIDRITSNQVSENIFSLLRHNATRQADTLALPTQTGYHFIKQEEIVYLESKGNYTQFHLQDNKKILISHQLGEYDKLLCPKIFFRIHEQYIVQLSCIAEYIKGEGVKLNNGHILPVAVRRKADLLSRFGKLVRQKNL